MLTVDERSYGVTIDDLKNFRQLDSMTPGHPENFVTPGIEVSTGPLGQGISNAVGMAIAERHLAATFNKPDCKIVDNFTYVICGDGCLQEGVSAEACSLGGHLGLGRLIVLYDDNSVRSSFIVEGLLSVGSESVASCLPLYTMYLVSGEGDKKDNRTKPWRVRIFCPK